MNIPFGNFGNSGEQFDSDLQMQYLRARYYDQNNGRFNSVDPFSGNRYDPQSLHKYGYAHSDPVNGTDPSGNTTLIEALSVVAIQSILLVMIGGAIANKMTGGALFEGLRMTLDFLQEIGTWYVAVVNVFVALYSIVTNPAALGYMLGYLLLNIFTGGVSGIFKNIFDAIDTVAKTAMGLGKLFASKRATKTQIATVFALTLSLIIATLAVGVIIGLLIAGVMKYIIPVIGKMIGWIAAKFRAFRSGGGAKITPQVILNKQAGDAASDAIARRFPDADREVTLPTTDGVRRIDVLTKEGLAIESKVGRTSLSKSVRRQILKDVELINDPTSGVNEVIWEFNKSGVTGKVGPTAPLEAFLKTNGIGVVIP